MVWGLIMNFGLDTIEYFPATINLDHRLSSKDVEVLRIMQALTVFALVTALMVSQVQIK